MTHSSNLNPHRTCLAVVLAAGEGTRMRSATPKVLHNVAGRTMLLHVLNGVSAAGAQEVAVVVGPGREDVSNEARREHHNAHLFEQTERLGTAHAVLAAKDVLEKGYDDVIVAYADTPLITPQTFVRLREALHQGATVVVLGFEPVDPKGYGRLVMAKDQVGDQLVAIREEKDCTAEEKNIRLSNAGLMAFAGKDALNILNQIGRNNAQNEYYLTDAVEIAQAKGLKTAVVIADADEVMGVNDRVQLAQAESLMQQRLREAAMRSGVTMIDPQSVTLSMDTIFARDVTVEPHVVFGAKVDVGEGAVIHAFSHISEAKICAHANIGPFARIRPGSEVGEGARVGNFVEIKNTKLGAGAKVNHLSYIGDAHVGDEANIGAGTITCNYDGVRKYKTTIGAGAFIGSNSSLVAPIKIGAGAYIGSGSVVTFDVPDHALAVARGRQTIKEGWAAQFSKKGKGE
jgi:bifunctional UDP-N-acetylglucosamine pyrophosphorylase / glucosamine-1-phosphate N-acetyltransferase